jgi:hypothetical protein
LPEVYKLQAEGLDKERVEMEAKRINMKNLRRKAVMIEITKTVE